MIPAHNNCLFWAVSKVMHEGGRLGIRKTKAWPGFFHITWHSPDGRVQSFVPWESGFNPIGIWFSGYVKTHYSPVLYEWGV